MNSYGPTETEEPAAPQSPPPTRTPDWKAGFDNLGQLRRSSTDRKLAGVCGGIARHLGIDTT
ncbi:MAG TPA: PspC domain-containing protein, partial [Marmoricola sp.]|nr:PspC domain-containing protein [Marmoricola sp.]